MENICVVCKKLSEVACYCDNAVRSCHNNEIFPNEKLLEKTNLQSFEFSKNLA